MIIIRIFLILSFALISEAALSCSELPPPNFRKELKNANSIFVFRLLSSKLIVEKLGETARSEFTEGDIQVVDRLKGSRINFKKIRFYSNHRCGSRRLDVGHYYVVATTKSGATLELYDNDISLLDINNDYCDSCKIVSQKSWVLNILTSYINGHPLPKNFPKAELVYYTLALPAPPPPPPELRKRQP